MDNKWHELQEIKDWLFSVWAKSLWVCVALVVGFSLGFLIKGNEIIDDCKFMKSFRIGNSSFNCERRI